MSETVNPLDAPAYEMAGMAESKKTKKTAAATSLNTASTTASSDGGSHRSHRSGKTRSHRQRQHRASMSVEQMAATTQVPDTSFTVESSSTELSALKIQDAVAGRFRAYVLRTHAIPWYVLFHKTWYRALMFFVTCLHIALIVFEPASSINMMRNAELRRHVIENHNHNLSTSEFSHRQYLPSFVFGPDTMERVKDAMLVLEAVFLLVHWWDVYVQFRMSGGKLATAFTHVWFRIKLAVVGVMSVNTIVSFVLVFYLAEHPFNFTRVLRPILLVERLHNVRKLLVSVIQSFKEIRNVLAGLFFMNFFSAVVATALFRNITGRGPDAPRDVPLTNVSTCRFLGESPSEKPDLTFCSTFSKNCTAYWKTIWHSFMHLFTLLTTANYPDVMMPVVECEPAFFLFFAAFIFLGLFFLLNLVLAIVTNSFHVLAEKRIEKYNRYKSYLLSDAFSRIVMTLTNEVFVGHTTRGAKHKNNGGATPLRSFPSFASVSNASLSEFSSDVGWANSRIAMREARAMSAGTSVGRALDVDGLDVDKPNCCNNNFGDSFRLCCVTSSHLRALHGNPDADIFDSQWGEDVQYERGDIVMTTARAAATFRISQIVSSDAGGKGKKGKAGGGTAGAAGAGGGADDISVRDTKSGPELAVSEPPAFRTTSPGTLRIFVCGRSTQGEHPVVEQRKDFARAERNRNNNRMVDPQSPWRELRLTAEAWHIFTKRHYPSLDEQYVLGHFNYLHDTRCITHLAPRMSARGMAQRKKQRLSMFNKEFVCNVALQKDTSVAFGDFVTILLPLLDAKRIDQVCGFHFESMGTILTKRLPCMGDMRRRLVVFFQQKCAVYFFDSLVVLNSLFLISEFHLEDQMGTNWTTCNPGSISLCWIQVRVLPPCFFFFFLFSFLFYSFLFSLFSFPISLPLFILLCIVSQISPRNVMKLIAPYSFC